VEGAIVSMKGKIVIGVTWFAVLLQIPGVVINASIQVISLLTLNVIFATAITIAQFTIRDLQR
jgi:hypothetical protein